MRRNIAGPVLRVARRGAALGLIAAAALAADLPAQEGGEAEPLSKADVIRLLTTGTYSSEEIEGIVRRSCISFELTDRDRADFRDLGAPAAVMAVLEACVESASPIALSASPVLLRATVGDTVSLAVTARRRGRPVEDVTVRLRGAAGASADDVRTAITDSSGVARFRVAAGTRPERRALEVTAPDERTLGRALVALVVTPAPPASLSLWPPSVTTSRAGAQPQRVLAAVADRFGNAISGILVEVRAGAGDSAVVAEDVSDESGEAVLQIPPGAGTDGDELGVWAAGKRLGAVSVRREDSYAVTPAPAAEPRTDDPPPTVVEGADEVERPGDDLVAADTAIAAAPESSTAGDGTSSPGRTNSPPDLRAAAAERPGDVSAWLDLARAWRDMGRTLAARSALLRAQDYASSEAVGDSVERELASVYGVPPALRMSALGGHGFEQDGKAGLRAAELRVRAAPFLELWGRYDRSLPVRVPPLVRGPDLLDAYYGGVEVEWGTPAVTATLVEAGRREYADVDLAQNVVRVEQEVRLPTDRGYVRLRGGGVVGRWFDRDDWFVYAGAGIPVALSVDLEPSVWVGETVGTDLEGIGRVPGREVRGALGVELRPTPGVRIEPSFSYGHVSADVVEAAGSLWEGELSASVSVASTTAFELVARHQSPPGGRSFTVLAGGFSVGIR